MLTGKSLVAVAAFGALALGTAVPVAAATPKNTLVEAWTIDDMISLDPAEVYELSASEVLGNTYQRLVAYDLKDVSKIYGQIAQSWKVSADGKTISFTIRPGLKFASGDPITAADAVFSLQRAVKLDKSPAFILDQFGLTKANVDKMVVQTGPMSLDFHMDKAYAPSFVLYCLTSTVGMVVDKKLVMSHAKDGDLGYNWLKTHYAGSGPFEIRQWQPNQDVVLERNPNYSGKKPAMKMVIYRHVPEPSTQRLLLQKGDVDVARNLGADDIKTLKSDANVKFEKGTKGTIYYLGLNQKNKYLSNPKVDEALKYLVPYKSIADTIMGGLVKVHQTFEPDGMLGTLDKNPYDLNVAKAKELLKEAGYPDGFKVTMDVRNTQDITGMATAIQQTMAEAGIKVELIPGSGKQTLTKYRARNHDIYIGVWGPDYQDPNSNAQGFASNPDNADNSQNKTLAWRNAWAIPDLTKETDAALVQPDPAKRATMYEDLQQKVLDKSPYVIMFQQVEVMGIRKNVDGVIVGPSFDNNLVSGVVKH
ncbi:ABC transporter substrate-binding protein [Solirhodobacter olei]|uniref:ABC transporter substrate-binding protein n=1 Tax=Solirhodobacter olei TaxID=2493082 RepID=UPI000FD7F939|nr:ABC transporter substrate-binding protein [Solirhodobacter olei]